MYAPPLYHLRNVENHSTMVGIVTFLRGTLNILKVIVLIFFKRKTLSKGHETRSENKKKINIYRATLFFTLF